MRRVGGGGRGVRFPEVKNGPRAPDSVADHRHGPRKRSRARAAVPPAGRARRVRGPRRGWQRRDGATDPRRGRPRGRADGGHRGPRTGARRARVRPAPRGARGRAGQQRGHHTEHAAGRPGRGRCDHGDDPHQPVGPDLGAYDRDGAPIVPVAPHANAVSSPPPDLSSSPLSGRRRTVV